MSEPIHQANETHGFATELYVPKCSVSDALAIGQKDVSVEEMEAFVEKLSSVPVRVLLFAAMCRSASHAENAKLSDAERAECVLVTHELVTVAGHVRDIENTVADRMPDQHAADGIFARDAATAASETTEERRPA